MTYTNIEIKARASEKQQGEIRKILKENNAKFIGTDNQKDIYFKNETGRLKLRRGNIENYLIYYKRENKRDLKKSKVILFDNQGRIDELEKRTKKTHEILIEVNKEREIYFIENVKFHIDKVKNLGNFVEIEAISLENLISEEKLREKCLYYKNLFKIPDNDLIKDSYSDMLLRKN
ncbi:class IV adenylate cyclase [Candidatus Pacearchaeota archaeon]|nr:class IV adenylate cyclase [Candidatus Pacearchaeota archaeon]